MQIPLPTPLWLAIAAGIPLANAATVNVIPGVNTKPVNQVTYTTGGGDVTQLTEATGVTQASNVPVSVKSVSINDGGVIALNFFNTEGAAVFNANPEQALISGIGVIDNGTITPSSAGLAAYTDALAKTSTDTDLRNHGFHDLLAPGPPTPSVPDLDLHFLRALQSNDYVLISERWGNSSFNLLALAADGEPYVGANVLKIGADLGDRGNGFVAHDWNTGYASQSYFPSQALALTVFSVDLFFENTQTTPGPIYGFRIDNDDEADIKILGISADTFDNNPVNPKVIPEPSTWLIALGGGLGLLVCRRRKSR